MMWGGKRRVYQCNIRKEKFFFQDIQFGRGGGETGRYLYNLELNRKNLFAAEKKKESK